MVNGDFVNKQYLSNSEKIEIQKQIENLANIFLKDE